MTKSKLKKFKELESFSNVLQYTQNSTKANLKNFLQTQSSTNLELACGRAEYTIALAERSPEKKFIGIDYQGERLWFGSKEATQKKLDNVLFLRIYIENITEYFPKNSITEIWITFPDPFPKKRHIKKRLTNPRFLENYREILKENGVIHLKTDDKELFEYSIESIEDIKGDIISSIQDLHSRKISDPLLKIKTHFEKKHIKAGKKIYYLRFSL